MPTRASLARLLAVSIALAVGASRVRAGGYELLPGGTQSAARGGAVAARPENAMALLQNPAGLSLLSGQQVLLNVDLPIQKMCFDAYGYYGWGVSQAGTTDFGDQLGDAYGKAPLPQVCNSGSFFGIPQLVWAGQITDKLVLSGGFVFPTVVTALQWGGSDGTIQATDANGNRTAFPTPTRYELIRQQFKFGINPTFGAGYRLLPELQVGVSTTISAARAVTRAAQNLTAGTQPSTDALVDLDAHDYFVPSIVASINAKPIPQLDLMAAFHWSDQFRGSGKVTYETNTFYQTTTAGSDPNAVTPLPTKNRPFSLSQINVGLPWSITVGARYAGLLGAEDTSAKGKQKGLGDPMDRERWDVEVDANYVLNTITSSSSVRATGDLTLVNRTAGGTGIDTTTVKAKDLSDIKIGRHLKNSLDLRLGGSYSVLPRVLSVEAGAFYETRGIDIAYAGIDSFAFARVGLGAGLMWRIGDFDLLAAYNHIFEERIELAPPQHQPVENWKEGDPPTVGFDQRVGGSFSAVGTRIGGTVLRDPAAPSAQAADAVARLQASSAVRPRNVPDRVINAGVYTAAFNVISVGAIYHF